MFVAPSPKNVTDNCARPESIADSPAPQNNGVFSNSAQVYLGSSATPHIPQNYFTGLTLTNAGTLRIYIAPGEASDSTGSTIIRNPTGCTVDLTTAGIGGLDKVGQHVLRQGEGDRPRAA